MSAHISSATSSAIAHISVIEELNNTFDELCASVERLDETIGNSFDALFAEQLDDFDTGLHSINDWINSEF